MKTKIFVVTHKNVKMPQDPTYAPIVVGKNKDEFPKEYYRDDQNDNISNKNESYCELTAMYWIWKNVDEYDNIGICHYRRYLMKNVSNNIGDILTKEEIEENLKKYDIILPQRRYFLRKNVEEQYYSQDNAFEKDYKILREVIKEIAPDYFETFQKVSAGHSTYLYNIIITKKETYRRYCEWLFEILNEVEKRIDITNYTQQQKRIFGFMAERLMTVYVEKNNLKVKEFKVVNIEKTKLNEEKVITKNNLKKLVNKFRRK